ncbi:hypothetical protein, partial [Pseudomonas monteilii]|uniref:hypothetical protein n=1 Tax=Pseudomonas monteilii TaxID=76759 RepID=UPI001E4D559E
GGCVQAVNVFAVDGSYLPAGVFLMNCTSRPSQEVIHQPHAHHGMHMGIFITSDHGVTPMPDRGLTVELLCI